MIRIPDWLARRAVSEVGVVGVPDARWGQVPVAAVVVAAGHAPDGALAAEVLAFCRARLATYKCPRSVHFCAALPRTASGKLRRAELRAQLISSDE